jgi:6-pyruvoyltetrahydropterin/6-carboxytetrahydropterin synthase
VAKVAMYITRKAEFSASHVCRVKGWSDEENVEIYGEEANASGHGHNYVLEVTVEGEPDPVTGMVMDLKGLKDVLEREVIEPMDHRFLNHEVTPFDAVVPTTGNVAHEIWRRLDGQLCGPNYSLAKVRLFEGPDLYVDVVRKDRA